ncbi:hypothetical protein J4408_00860 [Candidatus Pacearchaeota archaeon]|nr:hypothetical protein [Candidatus Pacearchaeota archaeon]
MTLSEETIEKNGFRYYARDVFTRNQENMDVITLYLEKKFDEDPNYSKEHEWHTLFIHGAKRVNFDSEERMEEFYRKLIGENLRVPIFKKKKEKANFWGFNRLKTFFNKCEESKLDEIIKGRDGERYYIIFDHKINWFKRDRELRKYRANLERENPFEADAAFFWTHIDKKTPFITGVF